MQQENAKEAASRKALEFVREGMILGLGTGSTAAHFIHNLTLHGPKVQAVATSRVSEKMAKEGGIPLLDINVITSIDLTVDGADEIDSSLSLIKGAGGALVREKIIASMSREMIVIADESKLVKTLGNCPLPIEIIPFGVEATKKKISELGFSGEWRQQEDGSLYLTDNGNWILDITFPSPPMEPEKIHTALLSIPGVVDTGFFFGLATKAIIGKDDKTTRILS